MSIFGAMQSGISGMAAQSSAMGAISDNISNLSTVGYKNNNVAFQTLVTKQTSVNSYSPGGVQPVTKQGIDVQGLLAANVSSTAIGISGNGFFVVNQAANPGEGDLWAYTRAGDFGIDDNGYLKNTGGFYAQGWPLLPWDNNPLASVVDINGIKYMKAYYASDGSTVYINDNIVDSKNLQPINLSRIGGTATPTQQLSYGANLPSGDPVFDPSVPTAGGRHSVSALIYDSLGNSSNLSITYTKQTSNSWGMSCSVPSGAANMILSGSFENSDGGAADVYYAAGQLEFTSVPANGSSITITDQASGKNYVFDFLNAGGTVPTDPDANNIHIAVDIQTGVTSPSDFVQKFNEAIQANLPSANRFTTSGNSIQIVQSSAGGGLVIDASKTLACVQSAANPVLETGIPTGIFNIPEIDEDIKNTARFDFSSTNSADYLGKSITIDGVNYEFINGAATGTQIDISGALNPDGSVNVKTLVSLAVNTIKQNVTEPDRFNASGSSIEILPTSTGDNITINLNGIAGVTGKLRNNGGAWVEGAAVSNGNYTIANRFNTNGTDIEQGSIVPAVRFNSDGTPKYFFVDDMQIEWANGAENMNNGYQQGTSIKIGMGNVGTNDGLTSLSGSFTTNYIKQDGAKFGSYAGVHINENGVVTAQFDNGETRPIAILPLATFTNANGMSALTGNSWIETDASGQALLKQAGTNGAGEIASNALESSTVDLATEFSNMIVTQRAYSASTKIITTADEMLDELTRLV